MIYFKDLADKKKLDEIKDCCKTLEKARIMGNKDGVIAMQEKIIKIQNEILDRQTILIEDVFKTMKINEDTLLDVMTQECI